MSLADPIEKSSESAVAPGEAMLDQGFAKDFI